MRSMKSYVATALALGLITLGGCAADTTQSDGLPEEIDLANLPEVEGAFQAVVLAKTPTFIEGTLAVEVDTAETAVITRRAVDSAILVNGVESKDSTGVVATALTVKKLVVTAKQAATAEAVILDFLGGTFGAGTVAGFGISIDLAGGSSDRFIVRGSTANDIFAMGVDNSIGFNADAFKDIELLNVENVSVLLAAGDDQFYAVNPVIRQGVAGTVDLALSVFGGAGNDTIVGGAQVNTLNGGLGNDLLTGGPLADPISGGAGNDTITGGLGADTALAGDEGDDTFLMGTESDGSDTLDCGVGVDTVSYALRAGVITASLASTGGVSGETDTYTTCENLLGGSGSDALTGNASANILTGGLGDDTLIGAAGDDVLTGGDGKDKFQGDAGNDTFNGDNGDDIFDEGNAAKGAGNDIINGGAGIDLIDYRGRILDLTVSMDGKAADDGVSGETDNVKADIENIVGARTKKNTIVGNALNNRIVGGQMDDVLSGGAGDDVFVALEGHDTMNGEAGNDIFDEQNDVGDDVLNGGLGLDLADYSKRLAALTLTMGDDTGNDGTFEGTAKAAWLVGDDTNTDGTMDYLAVDCDGDANVTNVPALVLSTVDEDVNGNGVLDAGEDLDADGYLDCIEIDVDADAEMEVQEYHESDNVASDVENVKGGSGVDSITGNGLDNSINGGGGADTLLSGLAGDDVIDGDAAGAASVICGAGTDIALNKTGAGTYNADCEAQSL